jgi:hypothetical protein
MTAISKRHLIKGGAALAVAASVVPLAARAEGLTELERLIEVHRAAHVAFGEAVDREWEAEAAYKALNPEKPLVRSQLLGGKYELYDRASVAGSLRRDFERHVDAVRPLARIAPEVFERARKAFAATLKKDMRELDKIVREERKRQDGVGWPAAKRASGRADEAETEALTAICAYPCRTLLEARRKAEYLTEHVARGCEVREEDMEAVIASFLTKEVQS